MIRIHLLAPLSAAFAALVLFPVPAHARAPLSLGTIDPGAIVRLQSCPAGYNPGMTCFRGEVDNCQNVTNLGFTYGFENPPSDIDGTIVMLAGGAGTGTYDDPGYAEQYLLNNYQVVYMAWDSDWEMTSPDAGSNIKDAACRPATFLNYIFKNIYRQGGMCAQGFSAGSGALGYALAWFGSASYLDNVELLSGPVFGDIEQGCVVPTAAKVNVCTTGQFGCDGTQWSDSPAYVNGDEDLIRRWSGQQGCNAGKTTSSFVNSIWKGMSIVDGSNNPIFSYPQTSMAGYLCSNVGSVQNNSAAQGEFFYQEFTNSGQTAGYSLTRINDCSGSEGVTGGETPDGESGFAAVTEHMISSCVNRHNSRRH